MWALLYVKIENWLFGKTPITRNTKQAHVFTTTVVFFIKISQYKIQRVNCVMGYSRIKTFELLVEIITWPFFGPLKWDHAYKKWTCWSGTSLKIVGYNGYPVWNLGTCQSHTHSIWFTILPTSDTSNNASLVLWYFPLSCRIPWQW